MLKFNQILKGYDELHAILDEIPDRVQTRIFRLAGRKVGKAVAAQATTNTPRRATEGKDGLGHLQDRYDFVQRVYRASGKTVFVIGSKSGSKNRINHLVEEGTNQRWTGHKTRRVRQPGATMVRNRKVKRPGGGYRTVKETVRKRDTRVSAGSIRKQNSDGTLASMSYRGRMPAYHQLRKAWDAVDVEGIVETEVRAGLQRIADRNSSST